MNASRRCANAAIALVVSALGACDKPTAPRVPSALEAVGSTAVSGSVATVLAGPFTVRVKDNRGRPVSGITVSCVVESGGGSIAIAAPTSKSDGTASCGAWTLGTHSGPQVLTVTAPQIAPVRFTATTAAGVATQVVLISPPPSIIRSGIAPDAPVAVQARDVYGNSAPAPGLVITLLVNNAVVTGGVETLDATGRAVFASLRVSGVAGARTMVFTSNVVTITLPPPAGFTLTAGVATQLVVTQSLPATVQSSAVVTPAPRVQLRDADGNNVAQSAVVVEATAGAATVSGGTVATDAQGGAIFAAMTINGTPGSYAMVFNSTGLQPTAPIPFQLIAPSVTPASVEFGIGDAKVVVLDPGQIFTMPTVVLRNNTGAVLAGSPVTLTVRSPGVASIGADGRLTAGETGRTTVVATSVSVPALTDSIVVHVTRGPGPLLRTDLTALTLTVGTPVDVRVFFDARAAGALSAVTLDLAYPRNAPSLLSFQSVTTTPNTTATASPTAGLIRLVYINATGESGLVELARIRFGVTTSTPHFSQIILTPLQVVSAALQDLTNVTSSVNPIFSTRQ